MKNEIYVYGYNKNYYSYLDGIIMRSKRRRMARRYFELGAGLGKFLLASVAVYGSFYFVWSMLCFVFPEW